MYRTAFLPALMALFVVAFALENRPAPATSRIAADAFDGARAFGPGEAAARDSLRELGAAFPDRRPGSRGDAGVARRVSAVFRDTGFRTSRRVDTAQTVDGKRELVTVTGTRPGLSDRRIVVLADRDALSSPGLAELSGTAALIELARIFRSRSSAPAGGDESPRLVGRDLRKTLVLVSTSGGTGGDAGARAWARRAGGRVDAVLVLGDLAGAKVSKPWIVPWSNARGPTSVGLRRTLEVAVRQEVEALAGGSRVVAQWTRRAAPATLSAQGEVVAEGIPAATLAVSGERGPEPGVPVLQERLDEFGRAALRALTAIDGIGPVGRRDADEVPTAFAGETGGVVTVRKLLPDWAVRLLAGTLLLPALLAALDAVFRARRRRLPVGRWLAWLGVTAAPLALAWAWARLLAVLGAFPAPPAPVLPAAVPLSWAGGAGLASTVLVAVLAWRFLRPAVLRRLEPRGNPAAGGAAAALGLVVTGTAAAVWVVNPYAAALLLPAAHLWLLLASPGSRRGRLAAVLAGLAGLALPALALVVYALAFGLTPLDAPWVVFLAVAGGHVSVWTAAVCGLLLACLVALVLVVRTRRNLTAGIETGEPILTRGPMSYAGPGSLGGTESALRR